MAIQIDGDGIPLASLAPAAQASLKSGRKNLIINGDFDVWQRGTSFSSSGVGWKFTADRWRVNTYSTGTTVTKEDTTINGFFSNSLKVVNTNWVYYDLENVYNFLDRTMMLSFYARSSASNSFDIATYHRPESSSTGSQTVTTINLTSSWQKFEVPITFAGLGSETVTTPSNTYTRLQWINTTGGDGTSTIELAQVQLEAGDTATDFEHRSFGEELALCQRYYHRVTNTDGAIWVSISGGGGFYNSGQSLILPVQFPVTMRTTPSFSYSNIAHLDLEPWDVQPNAVHIFQTGNTQTSQLEVTDPTVRTTGHGGTVQIDVQNGWVSWDAEL